MIEPLGDLVPCAEYGSRFEADLAIGRLNEAGIEAAVLGDPGWNVAPHIVNSPGFDVLVHPDDRDRAVEILTTAEPAEEPIRTAFRDRSRTFQVTTVLLILIFIVPLIVMLLTVFPRQLIELFS